MLAWPMGEGKRLAARLREMAASDQSARIAELESGRGVLCARIEELEADVRRYWFLAGANLSSHSRRWSRWNVEYWDGYHGGWTPLIGLELDAQIDADIAAEALKESGGE